MRLFTRENIMMQNTTLTQTNSPQSNGLADNSLNEPSTFSKMTSAAVSNVNSPGVSANIIGNLITDDPNASNSITQLSQMAIDATVPAFEGLAESMVRTYGNPTADLNNLQIQHALYTMGQAQNEIVESESENIDALTAYEQKQADLQNPTQDSFENVLNDFDQRKTEMQNADNQQANTQSMSETEGESGGMDM